MARVQPIRSIIFERVKNNPRARQAIADYAEKIHGRKIDPENWAALLAFLKELFAELLPIILKFIK